MRFLLMVWTECDATSGTDADLQAWTDFESALRESDALIEGAALHGEADATIVGTSLAGHRPGARVEKAVPSNRELQITGFYLIQCPDEKHAIMWANRVPTYGHVEVRPVMEFAPMWSAEAV